MAGEGGDRIDDGAFLSTPWRAGRDEDAGKLAYQGTFPPEVIGSIPESLSEVWRWVSIGGQGERDKAAGQTMNDVLPSTQQERFQNEWECRTGMHRSLQVLPQ